MVSLETIPAPAAQIRYYHCITNKNVIQGLTKSFFVL